jgi:para-nitrobenzyl esterase
MKHINKGVCANNAALRILGRALLFGFMSAVPAVPIFCVPAHAGEDGPVVSTTEGLVRGSEKNGVNIFLGIPYAAPPVGDLRWRPPAAVSKRQGTLDATAYANTCPQVTEFGAFAGPSSITEDCLYLNVFTTGNAGKKKPVIVWIHGGGNIDGESNDFDGSKLATGGPNGEETVVVTISPELGGSPVGQLRHPRSTGRASLGPAEYSGVRRRPEKRHAWRAIGRRARYDCKPAVTSG